MPRQAFVGVLTPIMRDGGQRVLCEIPTGVDGVSVTLESVDEMAGIGEDGKPIPGTHSGLSRFFGRKVIIFMEALDS